MAGPLPAILALTRTQSRGHGFGEDVRMVAAFDAPAGWSPLRADVKGKGRDPTKEIPSSKFNDGRIGWRRLPIRGQDVVLKWFFDPNAGSTGSARAHPTWRSRPVDRPSARAPS